MNKTQVIGSSPPWEKNPSPPPETPSEGWGASIMNAYQSVASWWQAAPTLETREISSTQEDANDDTLTTTSEEMDNEEKPLSNESVAGKTYNDTAKVRQNNTSSTTERMMDLAGRALFSIDQDSDSDDEDSYATIPSSGPSFNAFFYNKQALKAQRKDAQHALINALNAFTKYSITTNTNAQTQLLLRAVWPILSHLGKGRIERFLTHTIQDIENVLNDSHRLKNETVPKILRSVHQALQKTKDSKDSIYLKYSDRQLYQEVVQNLPEEIFPRTYQRQLNRIEEQNQDPSCSLAKRIRNCVRKVFYYICSSSLIVWCRTKILEYALEQAAPLDFVRQNKNYLMWNLESTTLEALKHIQQQMSTTSDSSTSQEEQSPFLSESNRNLLSKILFDYSQLGQSKNNELPHPISSFCNTVDKSVVDSFFSPAFEETVDSVLAQNLNEDAFEETLKNLFESWTDSLNDRTEPPEMDYEAELNNVREERKTVLRQIINQTLQQTLHDSLHQYHLQSIPYASWLAKTFILERSVEPHAQKLIGGLVDVSFEKQQYPINIALTAIQQSGHLRLS